MQLIWCAERARFDATAAECVEATLALCPQATLALPTGATPRGMYAELLRRGPARLREARYFNLDEYAGLGPDDSRSFAYALHSIFLGPAGVAPAHIDLIRGAAPDLQGECRRYDTAIAHAGGIELAILGLGANGHIAFNEPGSDWHAHTRIECLSEETRATNRPAGPDAEPVPGWAITMGIATLRAARCVLLLAAGPSKRRALDALLAGRADPRWPVTSMLGHPDLTVVADSALRPAAGLPWGRGEPGAGPSPP